jgi:hypothetical protein
MCEVMAINIIKKKLLTSFDTNCVLGITANKPSYGDIVFSKEYAGFLEYLSKQNLFEFIEFALSDIVVNEIAFRRHDTYTNDKKKIVDIKTRLMEAKLNLTHDELPDKHFDEILSICKNELANNGVTIIDAVFDKPDEILYNSLKKSIFKEPPFRKSNGDKGFKDNLIIESIIQKSKIVDYAAIFMVSKDRDIKDCAQEMVDRTNLPVFICKDTENLINLINEKFIFITDNQYKKYVIESKDLLDEVCEFLDWDKSEPMEINNTSIDSLPLDEDVSEFDINEYDLTQLLIIKLNLEKGSQSWLIDILLNIVMGKVEDIITRG